MTSFSARFAWCALAGLILLVATATASAQDVYQTHLRPMVQQYCSSCHGGFGMQGARGGFSFGTRAADGSFVRDFALWRQVLAALEDRSMPASTARVTLAESDRQRMIGLIEQCLRDIDVAALPKDPGSAYLRYLTKYEYACTMRDLLGMSRIPEEKLPDDVTYANMNAPSGGGARFLTARYRDVAEEILAAAPRERVVTIEPGAALSRRDAARQTLKDFQTRAYRRPASDDDVDQMMKLFDESDAPNAPYEQTMRRTLSAVLSSPKFLTHLEQPNRGDGPQRIDPYDLASRLSFFIWSSVPDKELMRLAGDGTLADPTVIEQQVRRMLADPRARALAENFGARWLGVSDLRTLAAASGTNPAGAPPTTRPTTRPRTQPQLDTMRDQLLVFLDDIFRQDKSLLSLVDDTEGGVLAQPAVLVATAAGERTSPPRRGKWVLQTLLGELAPRGPDISCKIPSSGKGLQGQPLYDMLATNRQNADCRICHERLDPPGMALEAFDARGWKREAAADVASLKQTILDRKDDLARTLVERMLAYALGRKLEPWDRPTIELICQALSENNYRSCALIVGIAQSYPFNFRRPVVQARTNVGASRGN